MLINSILHSYSFTYYVLLKLFYIWIKIGDFCGISPLFYFIVVMGKNLTLMFPALQTLGLQSLSPLPILFHLHPCLSHNISHIVFYFVSLKIRFFLQTSVASPLCFTLCFTALPLFFTLLVVWWLFQNLCFKPKLHSPFCSWYPDTSCALSVMSLAKSEVWFIRLWSS